MKRFFKRTLKFLLLTLLFFGLLLMIGILLPKETYQQKKEKVENLYIKNCNIVDVENGKIIANKNILVQNGIIVSIDSLSSTLPQNITIVNGRGKYIMPSLWDMHLHTISLSPQLHFPLLIANGVTGVRDMGDGDSWISDINDVSERDKTVWEKEAKNENLLVPKIYEATSFHVEEIEGIDKNNYKEKIADLVLNLKKRGEPFVKVQLEEAELPDTFFYELQHRAKKLNIPILGHLSPNLNINTVAENGYKSIEHAWALIPHCVKEKRHFEKDIEQKTYDLKNQDSIISKQVLEKLASKHIYYVPTHVTSNRKEYLAFEPSFNNDPNNKYIENVQLFLWKTFNWLHTKGYDKETDLPILKSYYERGLEITKLAQQNGVKILAGSDALDRNVYYGISLHKELQQMVKTGMTNAQALKTATVNATEYYGLSNEYGTIDIGKNADFILLDKNPLEKIEHTQNINAVFYNQRLYNQDDILQMKTFVQKQAKSFGISCKFIWNMIKQN